MEKSVLNFSIGIITFIACGVLFIKVKNPKSADISEIWEKVKKK